MCVNNACDCSCANVMRMCCMIFIVIFKLSISVIIWIMLVPIYELTYSYDYIIILICSIISDLMIIIGLCLYACVPYSKPDIIKSPIFYELDIEEQ